jgi:hypothetical protein
MRELLGVFVIIWAVNSAYTGFLEDFTAGATEDGFVTGDYDEEAARAYGNEDEGNQGSDVISKNLAPSNPATGDDALDDIFYKENTKVDADDLFDSSEPGIEILDMSLWEV